MSERRNAEQTHYIGFGTLNEKLRAGRYFPLVLFRMRAGALNLQLLLQFKMQKFSSLPGSFLSETDVVSFFTPKILISIINMYSSP